MLKKILITLIFLSFTFPMATFGEELHLVKDKVYLLVFNDKIENFNSNQDCLDAQIVHTIYDDNKQMIISLKSNCRSFLQIKTENDFLNFEIINSKTPSENLLEIDIPPVENLDVDIYTREN